MGLIFAASTDAFSSGQTSRFLGPLLRFLLPGLSEPSVALAVHAIRKAAHLTEYAVLAVLWWRALRRPALRDPRPWSWPLAGQALVACALWAAADELHQSLTATRTASAWDVLLDTAGAGIGLLVLWRVGARLRWWC